MPQELDMPVPPATTAKCSSCRNDVIECPKRGSGGAPRMSDGLPIMPISSVANPKRNKSFDGDIGPPVRPPKMITLIERSHDGFASVSNCGKMQAQCPSLGPKLFDKWT